MDGMIREKLISTNDFACRKCACEKEALTAVFDVVRTAWVPQEEGACDCGHDRREDHEDKGPTKSDWEKEQERLRGGGQE